MEIIKTVTKIKWKFNKSFNLKLLKKKLTITIGIIQTEVSHYY